MNHSENHKLSKIVGEVVLYILNQKHEVIDFKIEKKEEVEIIKFTTTPMKKEALKVLKQKMERGREKEIETYGWSLMGETELEITGLLIDSIDIEEQKEQTIVTLRRKRSKKS